MGETVTGEVQPQDKVRPRRQKGRPSAAVTKSLHSDIVKAAREQPLATNSAIAVQVGCDKETVRQTLNKYRIKVNDLEKFKAHRADILAGTVQRIVSTLKDSDIKKAPFRDRVIAIGVLTDKERLERGESTSNLAGIVKVLRLADGA